MKECELCSNQANMYCESDGASLCWECDDKVHSANFLVARHSRYLLCNNCQSPTPWTASGINLGRTLSVCIACLLTQSTSRESDFRRRRGDDHRDDEDRGDGDEESVTEGEGEYSESSDANDDDAENQVVPWSSSAAAEESSCSGDVLKRTREDADLDFEGDLSSSSSRKKDMTNRASGDDEATSLRSMKLVRSRLVRSQGEAESRNLEGMEPPEMIRRAPSDRDTQNEHRYLRVTDINPASTDPADPSIC